MRTLTRKNGIDEFTDTNAEYILIGTNIGKFNINKDSIERVKLMECKNAKELIEECTKEV